MKYGFNYGFRSDIGIGGNSSIFTHVWLDSNAVEWVDENGEAWIDV